MKKFGAFLGLAVILSCSVEDDFFPIEETVQEVSAVVEIEGCETMAYPFEEAGVIEITNDEEYVYISLSANTGYELSRTRLHLGEELEDFPLVGNGNLPLGKMDYDERFTPSVSSFTFKFPISDFNENMIIAAYSEFFGENRKVEAWAGDQPGNMGNWSYFYYIIQECIDPCENFDAGPDNSMEISQSVIPTLVTYQITNLYLSLLGPSVPKDGTFNPSIPSLIDLYKFRQGEDKLGDYTTTYTITDGDCSDSVDLTLTVVPAVVSDPCGNFDAGPDNSMEISQAILPSLVTYQITNLYHSLLEPSVSRNGTFNPSIRSLIDLYKSRGEDEKLGNYTTTYSISEGDCSDSVDLTLIVIPD